MGGREKKSVRDERYRENALAVADTVRTALKTAIEIGVPATAWAWTFWRVPWAWIGKPDADSLLSSHRNKATGVYSDPPFDPLTYNGFLGASRANLIEHIFKGEAITRFPAGEGDRVKLGGTEYKVTPFTDSLLFAARSELRDDLTVSLLPMFVLAIAPTEIGTVEKAAVGAAWYAGNWLAIELARFVPKTIKVRWLSKDGSEFAVRDVLVYELDWLDRIAFSAQAPLLAHVLVRALQPGTD